MFTLIRLLRLLSFPYWLAFDAWVRFRSMVASFYLSIRFSFANMSERRETRRSEARMKREERKRLLSEMAGTLGPASFLWSKADIESERLKKASVSKGEVVNHLFAVQKRYTKTPNQPQEKSKAMAQARSVANSESKPGQERDRGKKANVSKEEVTNHLFAVQRRHAKTLSAANSESKPALRKASDRNLETSSRLSSGSAVSHMPLAIEEQSTVEFKADEQSTTEVSLTKKSKLKPR